MPTWFVVSASLHLYWFANKSVQPSLDVEATIREGFLDIGVFCPENILGLREAGDLINGISKTLEAILDSDDEQT